MDGKRAKNAPPEFAGVVVRACRQPETCDNTGNPSQREARVPNQHPARVRLGCEGWRRGPYERRSRAMPVEQRGLSSRTMNQEGKARRLA